MSELMVKKDLDRIIREANDPNVESSQGTLKRHLGAFNLTMLGIGAIIGAGIFSLTGTAAATYAGPGIIYSFILGGILCAFAGLCYAEMAAMIPVAGSAYAYSYATMGEFIAWLIGWDLILEYAFGAVTVSIAWSGYFQSILKNFDIHLGDFALRFFAGPWTNVMLNDGSMARGIWNIPASFIALALASVLYRGVQESAKLNNVIVIIKIAIVVTIIVLGLSVIDMNNLNVNPDATGLGSLVPPAENGRFGWGKGGVLTAAGVVFFAYIGFDAVSTTAQEAKNPKRDLPIGILASLIICTVLYILISLVLTGVVNYKELNVAAPMGVGIDKIVELRNWSPAAGAFLSSAVKIGAISGLTSVILVMMMGQTRIFYAMSKDGLLPWFSHAHPVHGTPYTATILTGLFVAICGGVMPLGLVGELVSIGTLLAFLLVCIGVPILRITNPHVERPFKIPAPWAIGLTGAGFCLWLMSNLPHDTWIRLMIWMEVGLLIYACYGWRHSKMASTQSAERKSININLVLIAMVTLIPTLYWAYRTFGKPILW